MENVDQCRQRAQAALDEANDPSTTPNMRARLMESADRWNRMGDEAERYERERLQREEASRERVAEAKAKAEAKKKKDADGVLVLTKRMIWNPSLA